jgi:hypothetical protein
MKRLLLILLVFISCSENPKSISPAKGLVSLKDGSGNNTEVKYTIHQEELQVAQRDKIIKDAFFELQNNCNNPLTFIPTSIDIIESTDKKAHLMATAWGTAENSFGVKDQVFLFVHFDRQLNIVPIEERIRD